MNDAFETYERNGLTVEIFADDSPENPREWDNVGTMLCSHRNYTLGDEQFNANDFYGWEDVEKYLREERDAVVILPLGLYDHSGITMYVGDSHDRWDGGQVGFIFCTQAEIDKDWSGDDRNEQARKYLENEVKTYAQYLEGDVYGYRITNPKNDEEVDSLWGLYGLNYAKEEANSAADGFTHPKEAAYAKPATALHR